MKIKNKKFKKITLCRECLKTFNEKKFWEDRTKAYLEETKHIHKWKEWKEKE